MAEKIDQVIKSLENTNSDLYKKLSVGIPLILQYKLELYTNQLDDINQKIVTMEQPKIIQALCAQNLIKDTIEYKSTFDGKYKSYNIQTSEYIDIATGNSWNPSEYMPKELSKSQKSEAKKLQINIKTESKTDWPTSAEHLFNKKTQCKGIPRSSVIHEMEQRVVGGTLSNEQVSLPSYENLHSQNAGYYTLLDKRSSVKGLLVTIQGFIRELPEMVSVKDDAGVSHNVTYLHKRILDLRQSLVNLKTEVTGTTRRPQRDSIVDFIISFGNNWRLYTAQYINISLLGPPGSGKTTLALAVGDVLKNMGILVIGQMSIESRATIVGTHIGETAVKVKNLLNSNLENVVFIDEAYAVAQGSTGGDLDPYGVEALNEIVGFLDKHRGQICIISAGYEAQMDEYWFKPNPGMRRRTPYVWILKDYTSQELLEILSFKTTKKPYNYAVLDAVSKGNGGILENANVGSYIVKIITTFNDLGFFENQAGDMETLVSDIVNLYFLTNTPITENNIYTIFDSFLTSRQKLLNSKSSDIDISLTLKNLKPTKHSESFISFKPIPTLPTVLKPAIDPKIKLEINPATTQTNIAPASTISASKSASEQLRKSARILKPQQDTNIYRPKPMDKKSDLIVKIKHVMSVVNNKEYSSDTLNKMDIQQLIYALNKLIDTYIVE